MKDFLILIFVEMGFDGLYFRQGTMINKIEPNEFFTYWNVGDSDEYADNLPSLLKDHFNVYFYCKEDMLLNDPNYLENKMKDFSKRAKSLGLVTTKAHDIPSGLDHYLGQMCSVRYAQHED